MAAKFNALSLLRRDLFDLVPYKVHDCPGVIKMDANENSHGFPPEVLAEILKRARGLALNRYPDSSARQLRDKIAAHAGLGPENVVVGNGSDEIILNIMLAFAAGAKAAVTVPTFGMYTVHAKIAGAKVVEVPRRKRDFGVDVETLLRACADPDVKVVIICSPNNPTGNATPPQDVEKIAASTRALVLVDEAYAEFAVENCRRLLDSLPNVALLRTFSKAFGMAGLRVGYLLASPEVAGELEKVRQPFNLNSFSQLAAGAVLDCLEPFWARVEQIVRDRDLLLSEMLRLPGVEVYPSQANFLLFRTPLAAEAVYCGLLRRGVLVRNVDGPYLPRFLRVTVGTGEENGVFLEKLREVLREG